LLVLCGSLSAQITDIQNAAGYKTAIAAGGWALTKGTFAGVTETVGTVPVGTNLAGVTVSVNGVPAPVYYVSATQINFIVPAAIPAGIHPFQVRTASQTYNSTIRILPAAPGIFTQDAATPPKGAVLNQNFTLNTAQNPALRGEIIQLYGSGPGAFVNPVTDGAPAPSNPVNSTRSMPQVFIGGVPAEVLFTGLTPTAAALWQINVRVPNETFITGRVPVVVFVDGVDSNEVAIFVQ
jgi:uncharacterized protein (TIGR03437 family)